MSAEARVAKLEAVIVDLVVGMALGQSPWWCQYAEDGVGFRCVGCWESADGSGDIGHRDDCPAMKAEAVFVGVRLRHWEVVDG